MSGVPQGSPGLCVVQHLDLDEGIESMLIKFADYTKLGGIANTESGYKIERLENWAKTNRFNFNRNKSKILHLGRKKITHIIIGWG